MVKKISILLFLLHILKSKTNLKLKSTISSVFLLFGHVVCDLEHVGLDPDEVDGDPGVGLEADHDLRVVPAPRPQRQVVVAVALADLAAPLGEKLHTSRIRQ